VVTPPLRQQLEWLREANLDLLCPTAHTGAHFVMSLQCFNEPADAFNSKLHPPAPKDDFFPPAPTEEEITSFLQQQFDARKSGQQVKEDPRFQHRHYWKDISQANSAEKDVPAKSRQQDQANKGDLRRRFWHQPHQCLNPINLKSPHNSNMVRLPAEVDEEERLRITREWLQAQHAFRNTYLSQLTSLSSSSSAASSSSPSSSAASSVFHPLYMDAYRYHPSSLADVCSMAIDGGPDSAYMYVKRGFQFFNLHIEQLQFPFVHHQLSGESVWFLIPPTQLHKLDAVAADILHAYSHSESCTKLKQQHPTYTSLCRLLLYSKQLFPPLSLLQKHGVEYHRVRLRGGQVLVAHGGYAHFGFSTDSGETVSFACNVISAAWLKDGLAFLRDYWQWLTQLAQHKQNTLDPCCRSHSAPDSDPSDPSDTTDTTACHLLHAALTLALNVCPPAYCCCLLHGLLVDLQAAAPASADDPRPANAPPPLGDYSSLSDADKQQHIETIQIILRSMHTKEVRAFLRHKDTAPADPDIVWLCKCKP
jgi:hypothetical protein